MHACADASDRRRARHTAVPLLTPWRWSQVYKAMRRSVLPVAVKVINVAKAGSEGAQHEFLKEVSYLRNLLSPNIVQFQVP